MSHDQIVRVERSDCNSLMQLKVVSNLERIIIIAIDKFDMKK